MSTSEQEQRAASVMEYEATAGESEFGGGRRHRRWVMPVIILAGVAMLFFGIRALLGGSNQANDALVFYTAKRTDLPIIVTEQGNLESQITKEVLCEVENFGGDRTGVTGTRILQIVENGSRVKEGDLLVELDAAPLEERLDTQFLTLQRAEADKIQADVEYENQKTQNETSLADAELRVELAKIDLKMFGDEVGGTYQIEVQDVEMEILTAQASQLINESDQKAIKILYGLGYKSKGDLANARLELLQADSYLASQLAKRRQLTEYTYKMQKLSLQGDLETAERALEQVKKDNESSEAEALAEKISQENAYNKEKERYERYKEQVAKCTIRAPQSGMVAFAMPEGRRGGNTTAIEEGAYVRQRQKILTLPNLSKMQVNTAVHESVLDQVKPGLPATIRVDAFPELSFQGSVKSVAVLPDNGGRFGSGAKVYKTIVTIDEDVTKLKPGMTAVVQIDVERLKDIVSVPVQAVIQRGVSSRVYVQFGGELQRRDVTLGKTNDKFVHIEKGVEEGEKVVLNPDSILEVQEERAKEMAAQATQETKGKDAAEGDATGEAGGPAGKGPAGKGPAGKLGMPGAFPGGRPSGPGGPGQAPGKARGGFDLMALDKDGDGKVAKEELPAQFQRMFDMMDKDKSGFIETSEIPKPGQRPSGAGGRGAGGPGAGGPGAGGARGPDAGGSDAGGPGAGGRGQRRGGFDLTAMDKDGDGKIAKEELPEPLQRMFDMMDKDKSGFIEANEIPKPGQRPPGVGGRGAGGPTSGVPPRGPAGESGPPKNVEGKRPAGPSETKAE